MPNPLGDLISHGEGGYNSYNRGTSNGHIVSANQNIDFSQMTLDELQRRQSLPLSDSNRVFAVGKYQVIPRTLEKAVADLGLSGKEPFSPEIQERIFADSLILGKRPQIANYIKGIPGANLYSAQKATCQEWASVDDPDTPGKPYKRYEQQGNHATTRASQVEVALNKMRDDYKSDIDRGMSPQDAWRSVTGQLGVVRKQPVHSLSLPHETLPDTGYTAPMRDDRVVPGGELSRDIRQLQSALNHLGYRDPHGHALIVDGTPGPNTEHAISAFQRAHQIHVDGIAGKDTQAAMVDAHYAPLLSEATHPAHPLYTQVLHGIRKLPHGTFASEDEQRNLTVALTIAAHVGGLKSVDHVVLGSNGVNVFTVQGRVDDPAHLRTHVDRVQASTQAPDQNSLALHHASHPGPQPVHAHVQARPQIEQPVHAMGAHR